MKVTKKTDLTIKEVLNRVTEYQIYRFYIGKDFPLNKAIHSPFRRDKSPSFVVKATSYGSLYHTDYGQMEYQGTAIDFVKQAFSLNYGEALKKIDSDMSLGINSQKCEYKTLVAAYEVPEIQKIDTFIQVTSRKFNSKDLAYWNQYHISLEELNKWNVYAVKKLYVNRQRVSLNPAEFCFGYLMGKKWKIYRPFADKEHKWRTNIPFDWMWGIQDITPGTQKAVITKALKDLMVIRKILPTTASTQSESFASINTDTIHLLQGNCKEVYMNYDNDKTGVENSKFFNQFGFKWVNTPQGGPKDFADLAKDQGMEAVINHFKLKGII
jgi:hypothetical protein